MRRIALLALFSMVLASAVILADIPGPIPPTRPEDDKPVEPVVLERFPIARDGNAILIPVTVDGKERKFLLDTGLTHTIMDRKWVKGPVRETRMMGTPGGKHVSVEIRDSPKIRIGAMDGRGIEQVIAMDMGPFAEVEGQPIDGLLGMDFLYRQIVRINFDEGEIQFLQRPVALAGKRVPLEYSYDGLPHIRTVLPGESEVTFLIDTGAGSFDTGLLSTEMFETLTQKKLLKLESSAVRREAAGDRTTPMGTLEEMSIAGFRIKKPVFASGRSLVGLWFLSRFHVTLDFQSQVMYLEPNRQFDKQDHPHRSGVGILMRSGRVEIDYVRSGSPAEKAGVPTRSRLVKVGMRLAANTSMFELRKALAQPGTISLLVEHDGVEKSFTMDNGP